MSRSVYQLAIARFADGRTPCNCGEAYYTNCGVGIEFTADGEQIHRNDMPTCDGGCSANQLYAKYELVERLLREIDNPPANKQS